jgi:hypothetical protein
MVDGYEAVITKSGRVLVLRHPDCTIPQDAILDLLRSAGVDVITVLFAELTTILDNDIDPNNDRCLIPIDAKVCEDPSILDAGRQCAQSGCPVVVVFAEGFEYQGLHPVANGYGTQCGWSADDLRDRLTGLIETATPVDAFGSAIKREDVNQVKC